MWARQRMNPRGKWNPSLTRERARERRVSYTKEVSRKKTPFGLEKGSEGEKVD